MIINTKLNVTNKYDFMNMYKNKHKTFDWKIIKAEKKLVKL